jgi:hypothetical protein
MMGKSAVATEMVTARDSRNQYNHFSSIHLEFVECGSCTPKTMKRGEEMAIWNHAVNARMRNLQWFCTLDCLISSYGHRETG